MSSAPLLQVSDLKVQFNSPTGKLTAVDGVSFTLPAGRTLGLVGESGCGKSVTSLALMGLTTGTVTGSIRCEGQELVGQPSRVLQRLRGDRMAMIFQEPMTSLNPVYRIGDQIVEAIRAHRSVSDREARELAIEALRRVRMPAPERRVDDHPHNLSGGMRQRVMIAMALACTPALLIADEPTTALDVTIQAQILDLLRALKSESGTAVLMITHDLGVVAELCDDVVVMYAGGVVEQAPVDALFEDPQHPYTLGLLGSIPRIEEDKARLAAIPGRVPHPQAMPQGCRFNPRCPFAIDRCRVEAPPLVEIAPGHTVACWRAPLLASTG
jgi:peptide/nickel transport system ATP-binding protein